MLGVLLGTPHLNTEQVMQTEPEDPAAVLRKQFIARRAVLNKVLGANIVDTTCYSELPQCHKVSIGLPGLHHIALPRV